MCLIIPTPIETFGPSHFGGGRAELATLIPVESGKRTALGIALLFAGMVVGQMFLTNFPIICHDLKKDFSLETKGVTRQGTIRKSRQASFISSEMRRLSSFKFCVFQSIGNT